MKTLAISAIAAALLLTGCGSSSDGPDQGASDESTDTAAAEIAEYGFGQNGDYASAMVIANHTADTAGQFIKIKVNALDADGNIIATTDDTVEAVTPGEPIVLQAWFDFQGESPVPQIASVEPTLTTDDYGDDIDLPSFGTVEITEIGSYYSQPEVKFEWTNPTDDPASIRYAIVCRSADGAINGGHTGYEDDVPAGGSILIESDIIVSGTAQSCTAYVTNNYDGL